ncbi:hypothetical protein ElyMa_003985600 [Elysia marginata]|uniref:C-type lectin domain-containing protein n=1 Tax=Elysia marginata TaxID=1093978 RepID=A0AAV4FYW0_9GAST|nr:hypothetical protein ElyMa_003985600 [Elysia marginata]
MLATIVFFLLSAVLLPGTGQLFDYRLTTTTKTFQASENLCKSHGYDGLAVASSPEMYRYALRITEALRALGPDNGFYIGLRNDSETHFVAWDDGSFLVEDIPFGTNALDQDFTTRQSSQNGSPVQSQRITGPVKTDHRPSQNGSPALSKRITGLETAGVFHAGCASYVNLPTEAHGVSKPGHQAVGVSSSLSLTKVFSYLECVLLCGLDHRCRAAEFNSDLLTCMTLGPGSYSGFTANVNSQMFVRNGFP